MSYFDKCTVVIFKNVFVVRECTLKNLRVKRHDICNLLSNGSKNKLFVNERKRMRQNEHNGESG